MKNIPFCDLPPGFHQQRFAVKEVGFTAFIWQGKPGPMLLVNGGTHGDEYEGPEVLRSWAESWRPVSISGTVVFIPTLNEAAIYDGRRCHPADGGNLARAFPGKSRGTATVRLAHLFDTQVLSQCTHYIDLHSAGAAKELDPWVGYMIAGGATDQAQRLMASCFDDFWCWSAPPLPNRTLSAAYTRKIPAIYVECRGAGGVHPADARALHSGLRQVLTRLGIISLTSKRLRPQKHYASRDADESHLQLHNPSPADGLFRPVVRLKQRLRKGEILGDLLPLDSIGSRQVRAQRGGRIITLRRQRSVRRGDSLATLIPI